MLKSKLQHKSPGNSGPDKNLMVCKLTGPELQKRKQGLQTDIFGKIKNLRELVDGYAFEFASNADLEITIADYLLAERKCCPFLKFSYIIHPFDQGMELHVAGSPEIKSTLSAMLQGMNLQHTKFNTKTGNELHR